MFLRCTNDRKDLGIKDPRRKKDKTSTELHRSIWTIHSVRGTGSFVSICEKGNRSSRYRNDRPICSCSSRIPLDQSVLVAKREIVSRIGNSFGHLHASDHRALRSVAQQLVDMGFTDSFSDTTSAPPNHPMRCRIATVSCNGYFLGWGYIYTYTRPFEGCNSLKKL